MSAPANKELRLARKARRQEGRRQAILDAARQVVSARGLEQFTMGAVAEQADLSKAALFYYFDSKEDVIAALAGSILAAEGEVLLDAVRSAESGVEALCALARAHVEFHRSDLSAFRIFSLWTQTAGVQRALLASDVYPAAARVNDALAKRLAADQRAGRIHRDAEPRRLANVAYLAAHGLLALLASLEGLGGNTRFSLDELLDETCALLRRGTAP